MTFGIVFDVSAPIELYDAGHAAIQRRAGETPPDGLLVHVGRATDGGFQVMEIWESRDQYERFNAEVIGPALADLPDQPGEQPEPVVFEPRGLVVPSAQVLA